MYSDAELRMIESANVARAWPEIPPTAPPEARSLIVAHRARILGIEKRDADVERVKDRLDILKSL